MTTSFVVLYTCQDACQQQFKKKWIMYDVELELRDSENIKRETMHMYMLHNRHADVTCT